MLTFDVVSLQNKLNLCVEVFNFQWLYKELMKITYEIEKFMEMIHDMF